MPRASFDREHCALQLAKRAALGGNRKFRIAQPRTLRIALGEGRGAPLGQVLDARPQGRQSCLGLRRILRGRMPGGRSSTRQQQTERRDFP